MKLQRIPLCARALSLLVSTLVALTLFAGCTNLDTLNQFEAEWDRQHAPGTGITGSRVAQAIVVLATYEATLEQRRIAEQRARDAHARMLRDQQAARERQARAAQARKKQAAARQARAASSRSGSPSEMEPEPDPEPIPIPEVPKTIAVEVPHAGKKGSSTVMLFNTASGQLRGNKVYDLDRKPSKGSTVALFQNAPATYVGTGR